MKTEWDRDERAQTAASGDSGPSRVIARLFGIEGAAEVGLGFAHWPDAALVAALSWGIALCLFAAMWAHWPKK